MRELASSQEHKNTLSNQTYLNCLAVITSFVKKGYFQTHGTENSKRKYRCIPTMYYLLP